MTHATFPHFSRFPIPMAKKLGKVTAKYRWFALLYIVCMFFIIPGIFVGLSLVDSTGIAMYTVLGIIIFFTISIAFLKLMQSKAFLKQYLPENLHTFEFLPTPLRSLEPYDKILTSLPCCKKCSADFEGEPVVVNKKPGSISNPTFTILDEKNAEEEQQEQDFKDVEARAIANQTNVMT